MGLRRRTVAAFAGIALLPLAAALAALYFVARMDVEEFQGEVLENKAKLLARQLESHVLAAVEAVSVLARLPEVGDHLNRGGPYPEQALANAVRLMPSVRSLAVVREAPAADDPVGSGLGWVSWGTRETLECRVSVTGPGGTAVGAVEASFDLRRLTRQLEEFRSGVDGRAVLFTTDGQRLAGAPKAQLPPADLLRPGWVEFKAFGKSHLAGVTAVGRGVWGKPKEWLLAVVQPASELYEPFYFVSLHIGVLLVIFAAIVLALAWRTAGWLLLPILRIRHGVEIVTRTNLAHRIEVDTGDELEDLARDINRMAEGLAGSRGELEEAVRETTRSLQEERNRLAAVLRTMAEGVVVVNEAGDVILMNPRARIALETGPFSGVGGPLSRLLPAERLGFHLKRLRKSWDLGSEGGEVVVFPLPDGRILRGVASGVPGPEGERAGFLLVFRDLGVRTEEEGRLEASVREMPALLKGPVATARSLAEALERHPDMPEPKKRAFLAAVREEIGRLTERLDVVEAAAAASAGTRWPLVPSDPRELVEEAVASLSGVFARIEMPEGPVPLVLVEPFSWVAALSRVLRWIAEDSSGWVPVGVALRLQEDTVVATFRVERGFGRDPSELETIEVAPQGEMALPLGEAVRRNRGELWTRAVDGSFEVCLGLMRTSASIDRAKRDGIADEQPEFYDFDLFLPRPALEPQEKLSTPLGSLECVVFDSETTGLSPSEGDEVVSLSAIRIRRGKIQAADFFHTLVNPGRPIPPQSTVFHGIRDEDVTGAPPISEVFRRFREYAGDAVLVAHNAAFDLRFLELAARRAGLSTLDNPVLDTLFLSYGVHKDFAGHNLEAIARRLGVQIEGRHTSLGDAQATAEIYLKLLPLLTARGVLTLGEAKAFCDRMLLLRWQSSQF